MKMNGFRIVAAFLRRDWAIMRSYRFMVGFDVLSTAFNLLMFFSLGRLIDQGISSTAPALAQGYFSFAVIGITLFNLGITALNSFSHQIQSEQITGSLEALLATPANPSLLILSTSAYVFIRSGITSSLQLVIAHVLFGLNFETSIGGVAAMGVALLASVILFAGLGIVVAGMTVVFKRTGQILGLASTILGLLSGVYYPIDVLPGPLPTVAQVLPLTWGIDVMRQALLTDTVLEGKLALLLLMALLSLPVALWLFGVALNQARRDGSLGKY